MLCPICKKPVSQNPPAGEKSYVPFCSERCKLIDLGRWLGGRYQIPVEPDDPSQPERPAAARFDEDDAARGGRSR